MTIVINLKEFVLDVIIAVLYLCATLGALVAVAYMLEFAWNAFCWVISQLIWLVEAIHKVYVQKKKEVE